MENIDMFLAKPKDIEIMGKTFSVTPLTVNELGALTKSRSDDSRERQEGADELGFAIMKKIIPDITKEQYRKVSITMLDEVMTKFLEAFSDKTSSVEQDLIKKIKGDSDVKSDKSNSE